MTEQERNGTIMPGRSIDSLRNSAGSMKVGDDAEGHITGMIVIADKLYTVKERAIYRVALADEIDRDRTRAEVPNTSQRILSAGSESAIVQATILTAAALYKKDVFAADFDCDFVLSASLTFAQELIQANTIRSAIVTEMNIVEDSNLLSSSRSFALPSVDDLPQRAKSFVQKIGHALQLMFDVLQRIFVDVGKTFFEGFAGKMGERYGEENAFSMFSKDLARFAKIIKDCRNAIEHPKVDQVFTVENYVLDRDLVLHKPKIGLVYQDSSFDKEDADIFFGAILDGIVSYFENMLAYIASLHVTPIGGFERGVMAIPEERRRDGVKFAFYTKINGQLMKLG